MTGATRADVFYGMLVVEAGANIVARTTQDARAENLAGAPYQALASRRVRTFHLLRMSI